MEAVESAEQAALIIDSAKYRLESYVFSKDDSSIDKLCRALNVGTVHVNDIPLVYDPLLPVQGRKRN